MTVSYIDTEEYIFHVSCMLDESLSDEVITRNEERIKGRFAAFVTDVCNILSKKDIDMTAFHVFISTRFPPGDFVSSTATVPEVFAALNKNRLWDYFYYGSIEEMCNKFGQRDEELNRLISDYRSNLSGYKATTKISEYIRTFKCSSAEDIADPAHFLSKRYDKRYCFELAIKLNKQVTEKTLDYIDQFWSSIADLFLLPSLPVLLEHIREGCMEITWLIFAEAASCIEAKIKDVDAKINKFLQEFEVIKIKLENRVLYASDKYEV